MKRFGEFIVSNRWWVLAFWIIIAVAIVALSPSLSSVESNDQSSFIPKTYESIQAMDIAKKVSPTSQNASDIIVFKNQNDQPLSAAEQQKIQETVATMAADKLPHVLTVATGPTELSPDHTVQLATILYNSNGNDTGTLNAVKTIRDHVHSLLNGSTLKANITGEVAIGYDSQDASMKALRIVSIGTLLLVLILPALIFRSPFAGLLPIVAVGIADTIASALIADAATWFHFKVNQQLSVIFTVVLFGIGTDYILFLLFRYRERLRSGDYSRASVSFALGRAGEAILSAALVVLTSFTALFFAKFGIFSSMAPALVICVGVMLVAALTLVPALVAIAGTKVFWPSKAWKSASLNPTISKRIGRIVAKRPALVALGVTAVLVAFSLCALWYKADFSSFSKPQSGTESATGYNDLAAAFPAGVTSPVQVIVSSSTKISSTSLAPLEQVLKASQGIATVLPATLSADGKTAMISAILKADPYSATAINEIAGPIRTHVHVIQIPHANIYVGGVTAVLADMQAVTNRDLRVMFPIAALFIFIILAVLLRSLVAPLFLLLTVGLGYVATLGATTLIFEKIGGSNGLIFFIPLFMYLFVVAIGTDYNILTVTRLREEISSGRSPREAADFTIEHSSATVVSAGLILAATFGSLLLAGIGALSQMGSAVAIGVILAAFVIAPFLIPSVSAVLGYAIWWPGHRPTKRN